MFTKLFIYRTEFSDGRNDFYDVIPAKDRKDAKEKILNILRGYDLVGYGIDHDADCQIIAVAATDADSICEQIKE